jgi:Ca-activated chloride channel family protein
MSAKPDHYAILGVFRDASQEEIKRAYFDAAQRLHPDKNVAAGETELFLGIQLAYEVLSNPKRRNLYDATLPPDISENSVIKHEVIFSRANLVWSDEQQMVYVMLDVSPRVVQEKITTPPLNICLVLDRSTSMKGEKLDMVKATAAQLLRSLRPEDILSVVAFSDRAEVIVPGTLSGDRRQQENSIQMMQASGATELYNGLKAGMDEVRRTLTPARVNHVILLTDGHTYGDEQQCLTLAEEAASLHIGVSGMGIGHEWNDILLDALASKTGGSSAYISKPKDIQRLLVEKFKALGSAYADEVVLEIQEREGVRINYAFRLQPDSGAIEIGPTLRLGPVLRDMPLHALFELIVEPSALTAENEFVLMNGALKILITARPAPVAPVRLKLTREIQKEAPVDSPPLRILSALSRLTLYRMQERARLAADQGEFDSASRHLHNLATHLLAQGETSLAKTVLFEADNLEKTKNWSAADNKKDIKYRTRALLLGGAKENQA